MTSYLAGDADTDRRRIVTLNNYMKVKELVKELKRYDQNADVVLVKDWEDVEDGILVDRYHLNSVTSQTIIEDQGLEFIDIQEVILEFENERL